MSYIQWCALFPMVSCFICCMHVFGIQCNILFDLCVCPVFCMRFIYISVYTIINFLYSEIVSTISFCITYDDFFILNINSLWFLCWIPSALLAACSIVVEMCSIICLYPCPSVFYLTIHITYFNITILFSWTVH